MRTVPCMGEKGHVGDTTRTSTPYVRLLGAVCVCADGREVRLPSSSQRRLIARLALEPRVTVRSAVLCEWLRVQPAGLRAVVSRARRLLGSSVLCTDPIGYRLDAATDIERFEKLVESAVASDDLTTYDEALRLWLGPVLAEFEHESWAAGTVARVDELHCVAIEGRAAALIQIGRAGEAVAVLESYLANHPLRDRAQGLFMLALAAQGRQAEALRSFQAYRQYLAEEVGTVPSAHVRALERWVASDGEEPPDATWPHPGKRAPNRAAPVPRRDGVPVAWAASIPAFRSSLVGREGDAVDVLADLGTGRVVTLVGEGGVGKTRLASHIGDRLLAAGRVALFVELAAATNPGEVIGAIAERIGAPEHAGIEAVAAYLVAQTGGQNVVMVLDNCEHVVDGVAGAVDRLVTGCPTLSVLATSRQSLAVEGERIRRLAPLDPYGAATELFLDRADAAGAPLGHDHNEDVATICERLDGNPLAIELAAQRVAALGLQTLLAELDDRFTLLSGGWRGRPDRHRSLRAVVQWSDRLLTPHERTVFRALGAIGEEFDVDAAERVVAASRTAAVSVVATLVALVDKSMVVAVPGSDPARFRLRHTLRAYALAAYETSPDLVYGTV